LKDAKAQLSCVFFRGSAWKNHTPIKDGVKLRLFGELSLYEARGQYQLVVKEAQGIGAGNLHERFEALKQKLRDEGLFEQARKQAVTRFPKRVVIVTSPTGAVIQDLLSVLERRAPWVEILVYPVRVQGDGAHLEIIEGLSALTDRTDIDTIVLARGGGSLEDLWAYNEEALARAIDACPLPVVSAVGHETDFTIADFVSDLRAPTPSAAAELITPDQNELRQYLDEKRRQLRQTVRRRLEYLHERLTWYRRGGAMQRPLRYLAELSQRLDDCAIDLENAIQLGIKDRERQLEVHRRTLQSLCPIGHVERLQTQCAALRARLDLALKQQLSRHHDQIVSRERHLRALGPEQTLARGYSMILDGNGKPISSVESLRQGREVTLKVRDGEVGAKVTSKK
jgi:exodeoxyribonuclease VII large subunit